MEYTLTRIEARVLGALIEKSLVTPENYPLSLNSLTAACNQKTSRDPVMSLAEQDVLAAIKSLASRYLAWEQNTSGSRVTKYAHKLSGTLSKAIDFNPMEIALIGLLLLRGPQTPGELRNRSGRMYEFKTVEEVEQSLRGLAERSDGPFVCELAREPGRRETRFAQLFTDLPSEQPAPTGHSPAPVERSSHDHSDHDRWARAESRITALEREVDELKQQIAGVFNTLQHLRR